MGCAFFLFVIGIGALFSGEWLMGLGAFVGAGLFFWMWVATVDAETQNKTGKR
jgi:hypothetical protein